MPGGDALPWVVVCGAGALGANLVEHLARSGLPCRLVVIDHDRVERANLGTQPYRVAQVGMAKAVALADVVEEGCERVIEARVETIDAGCAPRLLSGATLVVDCLDNAPSRLAVAAAARTLGIACLHAGLGADGFVDVRGNDGYRIEEPPGGAGPCHAAASRAQVLLAVILAADAVRAALAGQSIAPRERWLNETVSPSSNPPRG